MSDDDIYKWVTDVHARYIAPGMKQNDEQPPDDIYFECRVGFVCPEAECKAAFCYDCMKDYVQYGATVSHTNEECYRIWYNKNKHRKLTLIKPIKY